MNINEPFGFDRHRRERRRLSGRRRRERRVLPDRRMAERRLQLSAVAVDRRSGGHCKEEVFPLIDNAW